VVIYYTPRLLVYVYGYFISDVFVSYYRPISLVVKILVANVSHQFRDTFITMLMLLC